MGKIITFFLFVSLFSSKSLALTTYTVGAGGTYTTILAAYNACTAADVYIIDIRSDYVQEPLPIVLTALTNKSAVNTVTIRPQSGVAGLSLTNAGVESYIFQFSGANYVILDGRPGGSGSSDFTISNNQTAAGTHAIRLDGSCSNITKGSNSATTVGSGGTAGAVFQIGDGGSPTMSAITIDNCTITKGTGGTPSNLFTSYTTSGSISGVTIGNNNFIDFTYRAITFSTGSTASTVSGNHFYQTASFTPTATKPPSFVRLVAGSTYTITGNYMGGRAVSCGGAAFTVSTSTEEFVAISCNSSIAGTNTIHSNVIQNIAFTTTQSTSPAFSFINIQGGGGTYNIGDSSNKNTFGATTGTGSVVITDNGTSSTASIALIYSAGTGIVNVNYNDFGAITLAGTNLVGSFMALYSSSSAAVTFSNNTVGNTTANNMSDGIARTGAIYYGVLHSSSGTLTASSNTIRNFSITGASSGNSYGFYTTSASSVTISSNSFSNITSARTGMCRPIYVSIAGAITASSNSISSITLTDAASIFYGIDLTSSAGAITCSSNTIGSSTSNNISLAGDALQIAISISVPIGITATMNSNMAQQFNLTSTGTSASLYAYYISGAGSISMTGNLLYNINIASTQAGYGFIGIYLSNTGNTNTLVQNRMNKINATSVAAVNLHMVGIHSSVAVLTSIMRKNKIENFTLTATGAPEITGIYTSGVSGWSFFNNVILLSNGANTNACAIYGIDSNGSSTTLMYHNTIKISGSTSSGAPNSAAVYDGSAAATTRTFKNNIFYNLRTGAGIHRAFRNINTSGVTMDYNYHEGTDNSSWGNSGMAFATFVSAPNANAPNEKNGTITIDVNGAVTAGSAGNIADLGANLLASVTDDFDAVARDAAPWIGAFESIVVLPIELLSFYGKKADKNNELVWSTGNEINNDYFMIEKSLDGITFEIVGMENGAGNSSQLLNYSLFDNHVRPVVNYYRLIQTDFDGKYTVSHIVSIDNRTNYLTKEIVSTVNVLGQEVTKYFKGLVIIQYSDGSSIKIIQ
jgi:hypothetical protein